METVTTNDILKALEQHLAVDEADAPTTSELARALNCSREYVVKHLGNLVETGQVSVVKVRRQRMDGQSCLKPGYRFK